MTSEMKKKEEVAREEGKAYEHALELMKSETVHAETEAEDYIITLAAEKAEGMYEFTDGKLEWRVPKGEMDQHIEVVVQDKEDKRFVPGLEVTCKLYQLDGNFVGEARQEFIWHPFLYHYGKNWDIPGAGKYMAQLTIRKPAWPRHDEMKGKRYAKDVTVDVGPIELKPGRKPHGPE